MTTYYIDPSVGVNGDGSIGSPFNTWAGITFVAGNSYLQACGTIFVGCKYGVSGTGIVSNTLKTGSLTFTGDIAHAGTTGVTVLDSGGNLVSYGVITVDNGDGTVGSVYLNGTVVSGGNSGAIGIVRSPITVAQPITSFYQGYTQAVVSCLVSGTLGSPIVIGSYVSTYGTNKPIINGNGVATCCVGNINNASPTNYITVDGIEARNISPASIVSPINFQNSTVTSGQGLTVKNCVVRAVGNEVIPQNCIAWNQYSNVQVNDNELSGASYGAINETCGVANPNSISSIDIIDNQISDCYNTATASNGQGAIQIWSFPSTLSRLVTGLTIRNNTITRISNNALGRGGSGIRIAAQVQRSMLKNNTINKCVGSGIAIGSPYDAGRLDCSGLVVRKNTCNNNTFGISVGAVANVKITRNTCQHNGSFDGATSCNLNGYGRGIEVYGANTTQNPYNIIVSYNNCSYNYCFDQVDKYASEGVGIGFDNNTENSMAFGNVCMYNEGSGMELRYLNNKVFGNLVCYNRQIPDARLATLTNYQPATSAEIGISTTGYVGNNTCVSNKASYGISISSSQSANVSVHNNVITGCAVAGLIRHLTYSTALNNLIFGTPIAVVQSDYPITNTPDLTPLGTVVADPLLNSSYAPAYNSPCIGAGTYAGIPGMTDFNGRRFRIPNPSIGAVEGNTRGVFVRADLMPL